MTHPEQHPRILAIALSSKGFGFAVFEGLDTFINWGLKDATGDKNKKLLPKVEMLISAHRPTVLVIEDASAEDSRRALRVQRLCRQIIALAPRHNVRVKTFSRKAINKIFFADGDGTRHERAKIVAGRFSEDVGLKLPPKRRAQDSEDRRMEIFDALALVLAYRFWKVKRTAYQIADMGR
jgi:hypothetical protein